MSLVLEMTTTIHATHLRDPLTGAFLLKPMPSEFNDPYSNISQLAG